MFYDNPIEYIKTAPDVAARINRLTSVIEALEISSLEAATNGEISSYSFNDGQSDIKTTYTTIPEIAKAIEMFEKLRERLINRSQGRLIILRDADTLPRRYR